MVEKNSDDAEKHIQEFSEKSKLQKHIQEFFEKSNATDRQQRWIDSRVNHW